ncbi:tRNA (adenine(58)-n(1))-methyltransferase catalytic subunit trmt61a [Phtheirospermum japonicum]|uniref:tRNA (adenine(58)-N(1))-methyltransferase n=1 Tax=Phtheirospermum japonicum TaxID=374723 RepID=A0A830CXN6_9LAMI|nr:tRNA (adenine(58)-n(1))-methyltransferase catalytic subunit trmt61a [Phtheirospermum japonicum]
MLPFDPTKKLSFNRCITNGDLVIVYERYDSMKPVQVSENGVLQNRFGFFKHCEWIGKPFGSKVFSSKGGFIYLLAPTPELWTLVLSHRTQILYIADISFVVMYLEVVPGCVVLESGTGSGSLTTSLARAVAPNGRVYTFDFHEQRAASAREDFEKTGLSSLVTVGVRDIQGDGFPDEFSGRADSIFLDLPQPWLAIPSAAKMLQQDVREGNLGSWQDSDGGLATLKSCKKRQRPTNGQENSRPQTIMARRNGEAKGHTGYLTFARLKCNV